MFKNEEYSSFLNIFIRLVLKHDKFTSFISLFRPLGYPIKPRPLEKLIVRHFGTRNASFPVASICFTGCVIQVYSYQCSNIIVLTAQRTRIDLL